MFFKIYFWWYLLNIAMSSKKKTSFLCSLCFLVVFVNKYVETVNETYRNMYPKSCEPEKRILRIITNNFIHLGSLNQSNTMEHFTKIQQLNMGIRRGAIILTLQRMRFWCGLISYLSCTYVSTRLYIRIFSMFISVLNSLKVLTNSLICPA